jgi:methyltransferase (TIGR00027 family)
VDGGGADLASNWVNPLRAAGFDPAVPAVWLVEGLLSYLVEDEVRAILRTAAEHSAPGSWLLVDTVSGSLLTSPWLREYLDVLAAAGVPWRFGTDTPEQLLAGCGWRADRVVQPGEPGADLRPLPYPVPPRQVPGVPRSFLVTAEPAR